MRAPADIQQHLRQSILVVPVAELDQIVKGGSLSPERRAAVHRNHLQISLAQALATSFPATRAVVGDDFFDHTARAFALAHPPVTPCLFEYGAAFPDYLDGLPALRELPYLGDLARFEWQLNAVHHAPDHGILDPGRLAGLSPTATAAIRFIPVPSLRLLASRYPVLKIWRLAKGEIAENVSLDEGGHRLLIQRRNDAAIWQEMPQTEFSFLEALVGGATLADAASADLDLAAALEIFLREGFFLDIATRE